MEENNEQIINAENSLNSEEGVEFANSEQPKQQDETNIPETKNETKRVTDRINEIRRQEAQKRETLEKEIEELRRFKEEQDLISEAEKQGVDVEELRQNKIAEAAKIKDAVKNDPEFQEMRLRLFEQTVAEDLKALQEAFPDDNITDIRELDNRFGVLRDNGIDAVTAYRAIRKEQTLPATTGSSRSAQESKTEYTIDDIKNMSAREIADNYEEVMRAYKNYLKG